MRTYSFYVGSTDTHDAHAGRYSVTPSPLAVLTHDAPTLTHGVREGVTENVAIYRVELATDIQAQRLAFALAALTGNDAILVVRDTDRDDYARTFGTTVAYRVDAEHATEGNRALYVDEGQSVKGAEDWPGYRYTPAVGGAYVAYLVGLDNTVTPVR